MEWHRWAPVTPRHGSVKPVEPVKPVKIQKNNMATDCLYIIYMHIYAYICIHMHTYALAYLAWFRESVKPVKPFKTDRS